MVRLGNKNGLQYHIMCAHQGDRVKRLEENDGLQGQMMCADKGLL